MHLNHISWSSLKFYILALLLIDEVLHSAANSLVARYIAKKIAIWLRRTVHSIQFAFTGLLCICSTIPVNLIGVRYTLVLGSLGWAIYSAALCQLPLFVHVYHNWLTYTDQNNRYGTVGPILLGPEDKCRLILWRNGMWSLQRSSMVSRVDCTGPRR